MGHRKKGKIYKSGIPNLENPRLPRQSQQLNNTMYVHFAEERVIVFISFLKGSGTGKQLRAIPAQVKGPKLPRLNNVWLVSLHFLP